MGRAGHSPSTALLSGESHTVVVGLPQTRAAVNAWRGDARGDTSAVAAGSLLCAWLLAEHAILRERGFLEPLYAVVGLGIVPAGRRGRTKTEPVERRPGGCSGHAEARTGEPSGGDHG